MVPSNTAAQAGRSDSYLKAMAAASSVDMATAQECMEAVLTPSISQGLKCFLISPC